MAEATNAPSGERCTTPGTTEEQATWDPKITGTVTGEQDLIAHLVATTEYFNRS